MNSFLARFSCPFALSGAILDVEQNFLFSYSNVELGW